MTRWSSGLSVALLVAAGAVWVARSGASPVRNTPATLRALPVDFTKAPRTLIIAAQEGCEFCEASASFHRALIDARNQQHAPLQIVVATIGPDPAATELHADRLVEVRPKSGTLPIHRVPALLLTDSAGRVLQVWEGAHVPKEAVMRVLFP